MTNQLHSTIDPTLGAERPKLLSRLPQGGSIHLRSLAMFNLVGQLVIRLVGLVRYQMTVVYPLFQEEVSNPHEFDLAKYSRQANARRRIMELLSYKYKTRHLYRQIILYFQRISLVIKYL